MKRNVSLTFETDVLEVLEAEAKAEHRTLANLIMHVIKLYIEGKPAPACSARGAGRLAPGQPAHPSGEAP
jgi:hypothetical protein